MILVWGDYEFKFISLGYTNVLLYHNKFPHDKNDSAVSMDKQCICPWRLEENEMKTLCVNKDKKIQISQSLTIGAKVIWGSIKK